LEEKLRYAKSIVEDSPDEALAICNEIMDKENDSQLGQMALFMAGYIMMQAERYGLAYHIYQRCAQLNPKISEIYSNMGMCLEYSQPKKAVSLFKKAYNLDSKNSRALANWGLLELQSGRPDKCIELSTKALDIDPSMTSPRHNRSLGKIMKRDWSGWDDFFDTLGVKHREARDYGVPDWNGEPGTVLVYGEQGVGDEIMYASCLEDLAKTNKIIFDCDSRLEGLFRRSFDFEVYGDRFKTESRAADQEFDYQCAIGQLPYFYRKTDESFPGNPYLKHEPERGLQWRALFNTFPGKKIGVAWRGGLINTGEKRRSLEIRDLEPLFQKGNTYISLEYKPVEQETLDKYNLKSYPRATAKGQDIDELAGLISQLDLVITACTTVVYIAGAMGIPCHVLVPDEPGYRYHVTGGDFPWYNSVKLYRKHKYESWLGLTKRLAKS
jgi:hypothetical protein